MVFRSNRSLCIIRWQRLSDVGASAHKNKYRELDEGALQDPDSPRLRELERFPTAFARRYAMLALTSKWAAFPFRELLLRKRNKNGELEFYGNLIFSNVAGSR
jgi:hypothetical protein